MHPRFEGARRVRAMAADGSVELILAESHKLRLLGLTRLAADDAEPLLFPRCRSIHMYWMRTPIDLAWVDLDLDARRLEILALVPGLGPRERASAPTLDDFDVRKRVAALELAPGQAEALGLAEGDRLDVRVVPDYR